MCAHIKNRLLDTTLSIEIGWGYCFDWRQCRPFVNIELYLLNHSAQ